MSRSRLAFLAANPRDRMTPLRQLEEVSRLRQALDASPLRGRIEIDQHLTCRYEQLLEVLKSGPEVLYFTGFHASTRGGIVLEDAQGRSRPVPTAELVGAIKQAAKRPRLVYLCSCYSDHTSKALIDLVESAVGFAGGLADDFANRFSMLFFSELFGARPVRAAFERAVEHVAADGEAVRTQSLVGSPEAPKLLLDSRVDKQSFKAFTARPLAVFISYGGPDQAAAERINHAFEERGIQTFLFAHDAKPGQPLHRVMHKGVNEHDWVVLLCSKNSLSRPGVLNEIEESMRRSSRQGGRNILVPVTIDDYVFAEWKPDREDLARYIRDMVIGDFRGALKNAATLGKAMDDLVAALSASEQP